MLTLAVIAALLAVSYATARLASWLLATVCKWVFGHFTDRNADSGILIGDNELLDNIVGGLRERNKEMAERLGRALNGGNSKKMMLWQNGRTIERIEIVDARNEAQQDELSGKVMRLEKSGRILQY